MVLKTKYTHNSFYYKVVVIIFIAVNKLTSHRNSKIKSPMNQNKIFKFQSC